MIHQPGCVRGAKPRPSAPATPPPAIAPITATPSVIPTCRLVDATAAATPACDGGMPDTAVFVIGGLTSPDPNPKIDVGDEQVPGRGVRASGAVSISGADHDRGAAAPPATAATRGGPRQLPEIGANTNIVAAIGSVYRPA